MIGIAKESLAPVHFESLRQKHRTSTEGLVPEIVFCLFLCKGIRKNVGIEEIAAQANLCVRRQFVWPINRRPRTQRNGVSLRPLRETPRPLRLNS